MSEVTDRPKEPVERTRQTPVFSPLFDIVDSEHELTLFGDMPGVAADGLDVRYENDQLIIHGKVQRPTPSRFLRAEYGVGEFQRTFSVGEAIDADRITAELKSGVLTIRLPKSRALQPRQIKVKAG